MAVSEHDFSVHPSSGVPIYRQIAEQLVALIGSGRALSGDPVPSIRTLAAQLQVNMMTISKAYSRLEAEGVLQRIRGVGMIVAERSASRRTLSQRTAELKPLMEQALLRGRQLGLTTAQIETLFNALLQESTHDPSRLR